MPGLLKSRQPSLFCCCIWKTHFHWGEKKKPAEKKKPKLLSSEDATNKNLHSTYSDRIGSAQRSQCVWLLQTNCLLLVVGEGRKWVNGERLLSIKTRNRLMACWWGKLKEGLAWILTKDAMNLKENKEDNLKRIKGKRGKAEIMQLLYTLYTISKIKKWLKYDYYLT